MNIYSRLEHPEDSREFVATRHISEARLRFYQRCRFHENPHPHKHPVYRNGYYPHPLIVLTTQREISPKEYQQFDADLRNVVMNFKH